MLKPITKGRWNKETTYSGLAKFLKGFYLAQGYPELPTDLLASMAELMKDIQARVEVTNNCVAMLLAVTLHAVGRTRTALTRAQDRQIIGSVEQMASRLLDKMGGPVLHEGNFSETDMAGMHMLQDASAGPGLDGAISSLPLHLSVSMSLVEAALPLPPRTSPTAFGSGNETAKQLVTQYGSGKETDKQLEGARRGGRARLKQPNPIYYSGRAKHSGPRGLGGMNLRVLKWTLNYVLARCAKERCDHYMVANDHAGARASAALWLEYARRLAELAPPPPKSRPQGAASEEDGDGEHEIIGAGGPGTQPSALAAFMVAEARVSVEGANPRTLAAMRGAVKVAQAQGDDVVGWLAALNEAQLRVWGAERMDGTFSEASAQEALDLAAEQRASCRRWGGELATESRCRAMMDAIDKELQHSREWAEQLRRREQQAAPRGGNSRRPPLLPEGRLPVRPRGGDDWQSLQPVALAHHVCVACGKMYHKTQLCSRCKSVRYCGRECQAAHWKEHKQECPKLAAAAAKDAAGEAAAGDKVA
ncbi:hypothetical protein HXX76_006232 [Chlamydomonas incerta]|uniref:MYND-type domain-containing protein n=1 Tax=Chlamydomonas incerta TaxID=51695 RepID=A0A835W5S4_CHLIN|nr:hypothetical protein HXX76_006232 [Chlamydomonas incerta]|eukprot:KAG2436706.1 hypothetical protein HXX76_006232 [Chlamydomonas incerta]